MSIRAIYERGDDDTGDLVHHSDRRSPWLSMRDAIEFHSEGLREEGRQLRQPIGTWTSRQ